MLAFQLSPASLALSAVVPCALAIVLILLVGRSASRLLCFIAFVFGGLGSYSFSGALARMVPAQLPELSPPTDFQAWSSAFLEGSLPEELARYAWALVFIVGWRRYAWSDAELVCALLSLGFALRENLAYAATQPELRVMATMIHGGLGLIMGNLLRRALPESGVQIRLLILAFLVPVILHGLFDASIFCVEAHEAQNMQMPEDIETAPFSGLILGYMLLTFVTFGITMAWAFRIVLSLRKTRRGN